MKCYSAFRVMNMRVSLCTTVACCAVYGASAHAIQTSIPAVGAFAHSAPGISAPSAAASPEELFNQGKNLYTDGKYADAVKCLRLAAEQGHAEAQNYLGGCYFNGDGVEKNAEEAVKWWSLAAEQGHAPAQYNLGLCYYDGDGVERNATEAVKWYRLAAEQGVAQAQFDLGFCYAQGIGVPKDAEEAVKWYRLAAEQGHAQAQNNLGLCYEHGKGVEKNITEAMKWYRLAAEQGVDKSIKALARLKSASTTATAASPEELYKQAESYCAVGKYAEAMRCLRQSADQGFAQAQNDLGICYDNGIFVEKNTTEAVKWYRLAAEQGHADAQFNLGVCYYNGEGVTPCNQKAEEWLRKAAAQGHEPAQKALRENF